MFYRPPNSSNYYDKDFIIKLDNLVGTAVSEGWDIHLLGDFDFDFFCISRPNSECKQFKALLKSFISNKLLIRRLE